MGDQRVFSPEDKEASRRRLVEAQRAYHHHAQDLVESFHSPCKSSQLEDIDGKKQLLRARAQQEEEERVAAAKGYAETTAAALEEEMAKKQTPKAPSKSSSSIKPRFMWRKTIVLVQRENAAREARRERESKKAIKGFGGVTLQ